MRDWMLVLRLLTGRDARAVCVRCKACSPGGCDFHGTTGVGMNRRHIGSTNVDDPLALAGYATRASREGVSPPVSGVASVQPS